MAKKDLKRVNKTKKQIVSDMQLVSDANRRRALIKDVIFPYLLEVNETIGYTKIFLQAFSGLVEGVFDDTRKTTTIGHINQKIVEKLENVFNVKDPEQKKEYDRYIVFLSKLNDISINDLSYAAELPRYIDGYTTKNIGKEMINTVPINEILGKQKLVNYVLKNLLNAVNAEDIITQDKANRVYLGGKLVTGDRIRQWQAEIKAIEGADIWKCTQSSLEYQAQDKIFARSENFQDVMYGKSMLYNLSIINSIFKVIKCLQIK